MTVPVEAEERSWFSPTMLALAGLLLLPENWDSCGAPRIEPGAAESAISLLGLTAGDELPPPQVVPTNREGSLQRLFPGSRPQHYLGS